MTSSPNAPNRDVATLAGGCFWCLEAVYQLLPGVEKVVSGYMGGHTENPSYEAVCTGQTGHAEVVQLTFDPQRVSYRDLLGVFFSIHDPTTLNRQGADIGTQYRSAIFYHSDAQRETAQQLIRELEQGGVWRGIVTEVVPAGTFYEAEPYHQNYYRNHPYQPYCVAVVAPKVAKFRKEYLSKLQSAP
jgi:peptide-methionine (S)-S-oxide reductase